MGLFDDIKLQFDETVKRMAKAYEAVGDVYKLAGDDFAKGDVLAGVNKSLTATFAGVGNTLSAGRLHEAGEELAANIDAETAGKIADTLGGSFGLASALPKIEAVKSGPVAGMTAKAALEAASTNVAKSFDGKTFAEKAREMNFPQHVPVGHVQSGVRDELGHANAIDVSTHHNSRKLIPLSDMALNLAGVEGVADIVEDVAGRAKIIEGRDNIDVAFKGFDANVNKAELMEYFPETYAYATSPEFAAARERLANLEKVAPSSAVNDMKKAMATEFYDKVGTDLSNSVVNGLRSVDYTEVGNNMKEQVKNEVLEMPDASFLRLTDPERLNTLSIEVGKTQEYVTSDAFKKSLATLDYLDSHGPTDAYAQHRKTVREGLANVLGEDFKDAFVGEFESMTEKDWTRMTEMLKEDTMNEFNDMISNKFTAPSNHVKNPGIDLETMLPDNHGVAYVNDIHTSHADYPLPDAHLEPVPSVSDEPDYM